MTSAKPAAATMAHEGPIPVPNATHPFWRATPSSLDNHRSTSNLPDESDIVIIGAGFSGAALAHYIFKDNPSPPSVTILEAREACSGATGRNGGHCKPDVYFSTSKYIRKYGVDTAVEVANFEAKQLFAVKELVEREGIDCEFTLTRACDVIVHEGLARATEGAYQELVRSGKADLRDVQSTPRRHAERVSGVKGALSCFTYTAAHLWPYKLIMHLLQDAVQKGANLQTHTPATHVSERPLADGRWEVTTTRGTIKAKHVLFATNAYISRLAPQFKDRIIPVKGICSHIVTPAAKPPPSLSQTYCIRYGGSMYDYLIPRNDGSIVVGGAKQDFWHERSNWYGVSDDSSLIEPARSYFDGLMQRTFLGWEDSEAYTENVWTGIMGYSSDYMPYVGDMPGKPGQMVLAGFSGHGMPLILLSAEAVVQMLRFGKTFEETCVPAVFKATQERLDSTRNEVLEGHKRDYPEKEL